MRLVQRHVVVLHAERKIDRVEVLERRRQKRQVQPEKQSTERDAD
jgi:hypothetical protein